MAKILDEAISGAKKIAIVSHINPDADALCSSFALKNIIKKNYDYKYVDVFVDGEIGSLYQPILRDEAVNPTPYNSYDLAIVLDSPSIERTGKYGDIVRATPYVFNIDHHDTNEKFGKVNFVSKHASSTCELIYIIAKAAGYKLDDQIAKELYQGIITDTNCFTSSSVTKKMHQVVSELLNYKFDNEAIKAYYFANNSKAKTKLLSKALLSMRFYGDERVTTMKIPYDTFLKYAANFDDTLGIIDNGINISGTEVSMILIEKELHKIYVSLRSKGKVDVGEIAQHFNGGGSLKLAAFQIEGEIKDIEKMLVKEVSKYLGNITEDENIIF